ncbi:hypothetical protein GCM10011497_14920 [Elstera cyanobacteriorum]|nr:hypothetical protein GCM10011497_14920 [Elstera cyanobacteriorum]
MTESRYLRRADASKLLLDKFGLQVAPATLAKLAVTGDGPPYHLWQNRAVYDRSDLCQWAIGKLGPKLNSTADRKKSIGGTGLL